MNEAKKIARKPFRIDGTLDIECEDWDRFCVAATYHGGRAKIWYDGDEMIDELRRRGGVHFAHAGGVYDLLWVLERARRRGISCQVDRAQHRVTRIVMGGLTLRDSYSLWPAPLGDLAGAVGEKKMALPWPCICHRKCGGHCQIGPRALARDKALERYVKHDAHVLHAAISHLADWALDHGIALRGTLGQTAWISAQDELGVPDSDIPYHLWRAIRQADKGGRGAIVRPRVGNVMRPREGATWYAHHDICNAYPAQLAHAALPIGSCSELGQYDAGRALATSRPGVYTLSVTVPDLFLPPLPWAKLGGICFPTGEITGTWALPELVAAVERGVEIRQVHSALTWDDSAPIFAPLVERWYGIRREVGRRTPMGKWIGGLAKALTGKFAERPDRQRVSMFPDEVRVCLRRGPCYGSNKCTKRCGAYEPLDIFGYIWGIPYSKMSPSAYPQWSSYLRAMTRVQWLTQAELMTADPDGRPDGGRALCMGNTDSLWHTSRQAPEPLGDNLGEWEYQHAWTDLEARSITTYAFRDPNKPELQVRGIPGLTAADWKRGTGHIDRGIITLGRAMGNVKGLFKKRIRKWSLPRGDKVMFGDRRLAGDGLTYPMDADELRALAARAERNRKAREGVEE